MTEVRRPERLRAGDRVAVVAPAGPLDAERLELGTKYLKDWGIDVELMPSALARDERLPYLAGDDQARAADFRAAWLDPSVKAVFAARGGYGVQRLLQHLDLEELASTAKILAGFSDITALHEAFNALGLVTVHSPGAAGVGQLRVQESHDRMRDLLFEPESIEDFLAPVGARTVVAGTAEGRLLGGNLALLAASIGTPTFAKPAGIVLLEDVGEDGYRVDRMLTQLLRSDWFDQVTGLVIGDFSGDERDLVADVIRERLEPLGLPMVEGVAIGHEDLNLAVPLGLPVRLDASAGTLTPLLPPLN
jgi:muramoyltetrapeptide carboxypeptidase